MAGKLGAAPIQNLGVLSISGALQAGAWVDCQRHRKEVGTVQIDVTDFSGISAGELWVTGRPEPGGTEVIVANIDLTALTENGTIVAGIFVFPQMRFLVVGGTSTSEFAQVHLME